MKLENYLLNADILKADNEYITDGALLIAKKYLVQECFKNYKTDESLFEQPAVCENIPFEKGEQINFTVGTKCELLPRFKLGITYNEKYCFDYKIVKSVVSRFYNVDCYIVENVKNVPILKFFINNKFIGFLMPIDKTRG